MSRMRLTPSKLKRMIAEEKKKLKEKGLITNKAKEVDADDYADTLVNHINYITKLGIKEAKLIEEANKLRSMRRRLAKQIKRKYS